MRIVLSLFAGLLAASGCQRLSAPAADTGGGQQHDTDTDTDTTPTVVDVDQDGIPDNKDLLIVNPSSSLLQLDVGISASASNEYLVGYGLNGDPNMGENDWCSTALAMLPYDRFLQVVVPAAVPQFAGNSRRIDGTQGQCTQSLLDEEGYDTWGYLVAVQAQEDSYNVVHHSVCPNPDDGNALWIFLRRDATGALKAPGCEGFSLPADTSGEDTGDSGGGNGGNGEVDADEDGYGDEVDCDDTSAAIHPGATEVCNGLDDDCDGDIDECGCGGGGDPVTYYRDADDDGYGNSGSTMTSSTGAPAGYVSNSSDCDDTDAGVNPGATDTPNDGIDQDCSGSDAASSAGLDYEVCIRSVGVAHFDLAYMGSMSSDSHWLTATGASTFVVEDPFLWEGSSSWCRAFSKVSVAEVSKFDGVSGEGGLWGSLLVGGCPSDMSTIVYHTASYSKCSQVDLWVDDTINGVSDTDATEVGFASDSSVYELQF